MDTNSIKTNKDLNIYDFLMYFGGFTVFLGLCYFIIISWETTHPILQVIFTLVISLLLIYFGFILIKKQGLLKLGFPLIFIALFLLPVGGYVLMYNINEYFNLNIIEFYFYIFAFLLSAVVFNILYLLLSSTTILLFTFIYYGLFYILFTLNLALDFKNETILVGILSLAAIFLGASGMFLSQYYRESKKVIYYFLSLFSINLLLAGGWFFNFFQDSGSFYYDSEQTGNVVWMVFYSLFGFIILNISIRYKDILSKIFSIMYLILYVFYILFRYLDSKYYFATLLLVLGSALIGTGYYQYIKKMKSDSIQNSNPQK